jgi:hypothetical protein
MGQRWRVADGGLQRIGRPAELEGAGGVGEVPVKEEVELVSTSVQPADNPVTVALSALSR